MNKGPNHCEKRVSKEVDDFHPQNQVDQYEDESEEEGEERSNNTARQEAVFFGASFCPFDYWWEFLEEEEDDDYAGEDDHGYPADSDYCF